MPRPPRRLTLAALMLLGIAAGASAQDSTLKVKEGDKVPDIALPAAEGGKGAANLSLKSFVGKKNVVLFFYPKANTPG